MSKNSIGLSNLFLWFGFDYFAPPKASTIENLGHRTRRGPLLLAIALGAQGFPRRVGCQPRIGEGGTKCGVLLRMRFRQPVEGCCCLGMRVFPAFATAEGRLRTETYNPWAPFGKPHLNGPTAPTEDDCGHQRVAPTIFQGHLSLQGTPFRSSHLRCCQTYIGDLRRTQRLMGIQR
jgi:hypothetical protein